MGPIKPLSAVMDKPQTHSSALISMPFCPCVLNLWGFIYHYVTVATWAFVLFVYHSITGIYIIYAVLVAGVIILLMCLMLYSNCFNIQ